MRDRDAVSALSEARAVLEAVEAALEGREVSDFMQSFPVVVKVQDVLRRADHPELMFSLKEVGEYTEAVVVLEASLEGVGTSRKRTKALAYALEDLAAKLRASA